MDMGSLLDTLTGIIILGVAWWSNTISREQKRIEILLNKTREDYATRLELRDTTEKLIACMYRLEDKLDKVLNK